MNVQGGEGLVGWERWATSARPMRKEGSGRKIRERELLGCSPREMEKENKRDGLGPYG